MTTSYTLSIKTLPCPLAPDDVFTRNTVNKNNKGLPSEDESNLLYVAVTRAKKALIMSPTLMKLIQRSGCSFEYPVLSSALKEKNVPFTCMKTGAEFKPYSLTLQKKDISLSNSTTVTGGLYSPGVLKVENPMWDRLLGTTDEDRKKEEEYEESRRNT